MHRSIPTPRRLVAALAAGLALVAVGCDRAYLRYSPPVDIRGTARGETPDIGAFEYLG